MDVNERFRGRGAPGDGVPCRTTRKRGVPSPDRPDALALAFMRPPSLQIWTGYEPFLRPNAPVSLPLPPPTRDDDTPPGADAPDDDVGAPDDDVGGADNGQALHNGAGNGNMHR